MRLPIVAALAGAFFMTASAASAEGAFSHLQGNWSGGGTISLSDGNTERIRCRATYNVGGRGDTLSQSLRCAGDSYNFVLNANMAARGQDFSGSWSETSRGLRGSVTGSVIGENVRAQINGADFQANVTVHTRGRRQSVSIRAPGRWLSQVQVSLSR